MHLPLYLAWSLSNNGVLLLTIEDELSVGLFELFVKVEIVNSIVQSYLQTVIVAL